MMGDSSSLSVEEYETYAQAESVKDFYYTLSASLNGSDSLLPVSNDSVSTEDESDTESNETDSDSDLNGFSGGMDFGGGMPGGFDGGGMDRQFGMQSDFSIIGYSTDSAMVDFTSGVSSVTEGTMFDRRHRGYELRYFLRACYI